MRTVMVEGRLAKTASGWVVDYGNGRATGRLERTSVAARRRRNAHLVFDLCVLIDGQWFWLPSPVRWSHKRISGRRAVAVPGDRVEVQS